MNANTLVLIFLVGTLGINSFDRCGTDQQTERAIRSDPNVPIASRLLPTDQAVSVYQIQLEGLTPSPRRRESFDAEIKQFQPAEFIGVVRVTSARGELTTDGTWVRTKVDASVDQLVRAKSNPTSGGMVTFALDGGSTMIDNVAVTAGKFWRFDVGERYLAVLYSNTRRPELNPSVVFRINANGLLEHIKNNKGEEEAFATNFVGRSVAEVTEALARGQ